MTRSRSRARSRRSCAARSPDLVLCGVQSSDAVQAATGTALAELLELPRVAVVTKVDWDRRGHGDRATASSRAGSSTSSRSTRPAVLTIQTGINEPRYATLRAIKQAEQKEIEVASPATLGEPAYRVRRMFVPPKGEGAEMLDGEPGRDRPADQGDRRGAPRMTRGASVSAAGPTLQLSAYSLRVLTAFTQRGARLAPRASRKRAEE